MHCYIAAGVKNILFFYNDGTNRIIIIIFKLRKIKNIPTDKLERFGRPKTIDVPERPEYKTVLIIPESWAHI